MANSYIRDLAPWPLGTPIPASAIPFFYHPETDLEYRYVFPQLADILGNGGANAFLTGSYTATLSGAQAITVPDAVVFASVGVEGPGGSLNPLAYGSGYTQAGNVLTVLAAANVQAGEVIHYSYLTGSAAAGYTDAQARAAQLNQVNSGSSGVITFQQSEQYPAVNSGTYVLDPAGAVPGVVVSAQFNAQNGATAPDLSNAVFRRGAGQWTPGAINVYMWYVLASGLVEYSICPYTP